MSGTHAGARRVRGAYEQYGKPALDLVAALFLATVTLPVVVALAAIAALAHRRWPIERLPRAGRAGEIYRLYRLRTTEPSDPESRGMAQRLSRFLTSWSLDELPQLWNVLNGTMSLVGPRPLDPTSAARLAPWENQRHAVKPGVTGLWQVEARGDGRDLTDNIHYDIQYLDQLSFATDLRILSRTLAAVLARREGPASSRPLPTARIRSRFPHIRLVSTDLVVWLIALATAAYTRFEFQWSQIDGGNLALTAALAAAAQLAWGYSVGLYHGRWRLASYEEVSWVGGGTAVITAGLLMVSAVPGVDLLPRGAIVAGGAFQLLGAFSARYAARAIYTAQGKAIHERPHKMLVFGAGEAGLRVTEEIWRDPEADALPVAFLDDDERSWKRRPFGLPIVGGRREISNAARRYNADLMLIAMPSAPGRNIKAIADAAQRAGLDVRIVPRMTTLLRDSSTRSLASDVRELTLADFLNREEVRLDLEEIAGYLTGKRVLVTGAGGSIGSVLCRVIEQFDPKAVFKLDRDENALHALQLGIEGRALLDSDELVLCDIRDRDSVFDVMREIEPEVVFHVAAHKHVTFLERHPDEALKTNVFGTANVLAAAAAAGTSRFVNVSTDKAADPRNVLGLTKRAAEMLTAHYARSEPNVYMSVRFGNVLGSKGSVLPTFRNQIERGEPVTVTDPDVTRFFMTIEEACELVVQAGAIGGGGDVYVLDMGEPVRIVDLATRLHQQLRPGTKPTIVYTGLRPGEKLHEVLAGPTEVLVGQPHELISQYRVPSHDPSWLWRAGRPVTVDELRITVSGVEAQVGRSGH